MQASRKILYLIEELTYITLLVFAVTTYCGATAFWSQSQSKIIMIASVSCMFGIFAPWLVEKQMNIRFSFMVDVMVALAMMFSVILGEACQFYYRISNYDKVLHFFATVMFSALGYSFAKFFLRETNNGTHQLLFSLLFGFFFAVAVEAIWEIYEFTFDSLAGTNMQKYIPDEFLSCIDENGNYTWSDDKIAAFYATQEGHQFAVRDTMFDIICDTCGGLTGILGCLLVFKFRPDLQDKMIYRLHTKNEVSLDAPHKEKKIEALSSNSQAEKPQDKKS
jgi:hypothetical protein